MFLMSIARGCAKVVLWESEEGIDQKCWQGYNPSEGSREESIPCPIQLLGGYISPFSASIFVPLFPLCVFFPSLSRTPVIGFRVHPGNSG